MIALVRTARRAHLPLRGTCRWRRYASKRTTRCFSEFPICGGHAAMRPCGDSSSASHRQIHRYRYIDIQFYLPAVYRCSGTMPCASASISAISLSRATNVDSHWSRIAYPSFLHLVFTKHPHIVTALTNLVPLRAMTALSLWACRRGPVCKCPKSRRAAMMPRQMV